LDGERGEAAVRLAQSAARHAIGIGYAHVTRTTHATLAVALLDQGNCENALSAARAGAKFFRSRRAVIGQAVYGAALLRCGTRDARSQAASVFTSTIAVCEEILADGGHPFWAWDVLGMARAGLGLCAPDRAEDAARDAVAAYAAARAHAPLPGAGRRAKTFLSALVSGDDDVGSLWLEPVRQAALYGRRQG
jgi:hypothetical protein